LQAIVAAEHIKKENKSNCSACPKGNENVQPHTS